MASRQTTGTRTTVVPAAPDRRGISGEQTSVVLDRDKSESFCAECNRSWPRDRTKCPECGGPLVQLGDSMLGRVFDGRYEIRAPLGRGGMGVVYRGVQLNAGREVAIKVIHAAAASRTEVARRFLREARLASKLKSPHIVQVFDCGQSEDGAFYLVMELLRGPTLESELDGRALVVERALAIAGQLVNALDAAHQQGVIHRDLKPGNIILADDSAREVVKVLDFGIAKSIAGEGATPLTANGAMLGTPLYMSPEQIEGRAVDARSDLYALGGVFYAMLTGQAPFVAKTVTDVLALHCKEPPPPLPAHVPAYVSAIVMKLLAKRPDQRFASCAEVRVALDGRDGNALATTLPDPAVATQDPFTAVATVARPRRPSRARLLAIAGVAGAIALVGNVLWPTSIPEVVAVDGAVPPPPRAIAPEAVDAAAIVEGAPEPVVIDAAIEIDAGEVPPDAALAPTDAGVKRPPPMRRRKPRKDAPTKEGSANELDELPFLPTPR